MKPFDLARFLDAQEPIFDRVLAELKRGRKTSHWMWFIFPQMRGLGRSWASDFYGISSRSEAEAYLRHPVLGPRIVECTTLVNGIEDRSAVEIFGETDAQKFHSSITLFAMVAGENSAFLRALEKYFRGDADESTLDLAGPPG
jgi:uncharacterized protein (DUF1810 family)